MALIRPIRVYSESINEHILYMKDGEGYGKTEVLSRDSN
jgi:hypothetical protein